ncbi:iron-containing alcohol dehydrogenase [bacterium]|nr:iron-containing alcohol dehydrogenase [bacterium]
MEDFIFQNTTKIYFGKYVLPELGNEVAKKARKVLLVLGTGQVKRTRAYTDTMQSLHDRQIQVVEWNGIPPNPPLSAIKQAIELSRAESVEAVVALGGGSVLDAAKTIAAGHLFQGEIWDCFGPKRKCRILQALPVFSVLTISATGSEMNGTAVVTNDETHVKASLYSEAIYPAVSFIDPSYQVTLSESMTKYGAVDIFCHVTEQYFNQNTLSDVSDALSEGIMRTVLQRTKQILAEPTEVEPRAQLAWAGTMALNGLPGLGRGGGDFSSHRIGHALSALYDFPHGLTLAIVLPAWMRYVYKEAIPRFAQFGRNVFHLKGSDAETASKSIIALQHWIHSLGISTSLVDQGVRIDALQEIIRNESIPYPLGKLRVLEPNDVENILHLTNY